MDIDESEDSAVKDKNEEEKSEEDGQNATIQEKVEEEEQQDELLDATPCQVKEKLEMPPPTTIISDENQWSPLKRMTSLGRTFDRMNETATRASLSGIPIDPRTYPRQLLQNLQGR